MSRRDLFTTPPPDVAIEIDRTHVAAARLAMRGNQAAIVAHASEALPAGAVVPGLLDLNMPDVPAVAGAIRQTLSAAWRQQADARVAGPARHDRESLAAAARESARQGGRSAGDRQVAGAEDGAVPDGAGGAERVARSSQRRRRQRVRGHDRAPRCRSPVRTGLRDGRRARRAGRPVHLQRDSQHPRQRVAAGGRLAAGARHRHLSDAWP